MMMNRPRHFLGLVLLSAPLLMGMNVDTCDCNFGGGGGGGGVFGGNSDPRESAPMDGLFTDLVTTIDVEVDYQNGAVPYTGTSGGILGSYALWDIFRNNIEALFTASPKTILVDSEISQMGVVTGWQQDSFSVGDILDIADSFRNRASEGATRSFYVVFLDGYYEDSSGPRTNVLGVSIGKTEVIAMFKPVIDGTGSPEKIEQTTLVHELGHAVGLVDNGTPAVDPAHYDAPHGHHCTNTKCIMYYTNEASESLGDFVGLFGSPTEVLFDEGCLGDAHSASIVSE